MSRSKVVLERIHVWWKHCDAAEGNRKVDAESKSDKVKTTRNCEKIESA
jgi:hypothetical protein